VAVLLFFAAFTGWSALAEEARTGPKPEAKASEKVKKLQRSIRMGEIEILGEVEKPRTMFVIPRAPHHYYWERTKKDFTEEILAPINRQDVEDAERWRDATSLR